MKQPENHLDQGLQSTHCRLYKKGEWSEFNDIITPEVALTLHWPDRSPTVLLAFPENLDQLATGHALLEFCLPGEVPVLKKQVDREYILSPSPSEPLPATETDMPPLRAADITTHMRDFISTSGRWQATGCFHRAAVFDPGTLSFLYYVEDIGRHNCIDRVAAWLLAHNKNPANLVLYVTARTTQSLVKKIVRAGFPAVVSHSATTTGGLDYARATNFTLISFAKPHRMTVFTDANNLVENSGG